MKLQERATYPLDLCYAIAPLTYRGKKHILVAAEKVNKCLMFDLKGHLEDTIWEAPGGTMSMVQVPHSDGWFLATHQFYSPNDSNQAKIVLARPSEQGWLISTIKELPFCHRFSIIERAGHHYLIACTLKGNHEYRDDWRTPGAVYVCELPDDLETYHQDHQLEMTCLIEGLLKNHGYYTMHDEDGDYALIGTENGVYQCTPPSSPEGAWEVKQLIDDPVSDMAMIDFDDDGQLEMITISPFHGDDITIYKLIDGGYQKVYRCDFKMPMSHAIWAFSCHDRPIAVIGCRKGSRALVAFSCQDGHYQAEVLKEDVGSANIFPYRDEERMMLVSANREISEIAFYELID